jgi:hypothetical protein
VPDSDSPPELVPFKATVLVGNDVKRLDIITFQGKMWLVSGWFVMPAEGLRKPERLICLSPLEHEIPVENQPDFVVTFPIPMSVFSGHVPPGLADAYQVLDYPDILLPYVHLTR